MKNIQFIPIEEKTLNDKLVNLYGAKIPGLYAAVEPLFDDKDAIKPALPLLIELNDDESYEKADLRIMVFGRETNNWNDMGERNKCPYGTYDFNLSSSDDILNEIRGRHIEGELEIYGLCDIYHFYCYEDNAVGKTVFTRRQSQLIQQLRERLGDIKVEAVWNNVSKIGCGGKDFGRSCRKPTAVIRDIEREHFNVVAEEVKILRPDVVIFLTGFGADQEIKEKFGITDSNFHPVKEGVFLDRIDIPGIKYAARTIHPSRKSNEELKKHFDALVEDIVSAL
ncbi:hypothetical protein [Bacteroides acidifaciens]|uniref:hypothetical protein n=1 Tax=Bacteroides acidifaciens TaxID=85831 RepID=UPI00261BEB36|nr:hypothetical protein [Bacteroides acidifaciens]